MHFGNIMIFIFCFVSNQISHYVLKSKSLRFEGQDITISIIIFCKKWFSTCMISPIYLSFKKWRPWHFSVSLMVFCTSIITSNQITRANYDDIIINNWHCSQRRTVLTGTKNHQGHRKMPGAPLFKAQINWADHARTKPFLTENYYRNC